jgi:hypothetical protein
MTPRHQLDSVVGVGMTSLPDLPEEESLSYVCRRMTLVGVVTGLGLCLVR